MALACSLAIEGQPVQTRLCSRWCFDLPRLAPATSGLGEDEAVLGARDAPVEAGSVRPTKLSLVQMLAFSTVSEARLPEPGAIEAPRAGA